MNDQNVEAIEVTGTGVSDRFEVAPRPNTTVSVIGGSPTSGSPGDVLAVNFTGTTGAQHTGTGPGTGHYTFGNRATITYAGIETAGALPPTVTGVFVSGTAWEAAYRNSLAATGDGEAAYGYRINPAEQARTLGWSNLNQISIRFSEHVNVAADDLVINGVNVASYGYVVGAKPFSYDPVTLTATWTLNRAIPNDKVTLSLDGDAGTGVTSAASGTLLDGEWFNPTHPSLSGDTFPSGDGTAGGDFVFNLRVLPGDVNRDGSVGLADLNLVKLNFGRSNGDVTQGDLDASTIVDLADLNRVKVNFGQTAPV